MVFWGRRERAKDAEQDAADAALSRRARTALVTADERIRATGDELAFAQAELGEPATAELRVGLDAVREHMGEAFQLHQLNHDHIPDTPEELRTRNQRIVQLCEWAESVLDERTDVLKERVERARRAPEVLAALRSQVASMQDRLPEARESVDRLAQLYSPEAIQRVRMDVGEADRLLAFALRSADLAERRRDAGKPGDANVALEAATETVRRAQSVFDAVDAFEIEAMRTQSTLASVIDDSRGDLVEARSGQRTADVDAAIARLDAALAEVGVGGRRDPFADLAVLSAANSALDAAREQAAKPVIALAHVEHAVSAADHAIGVAASLIDGHRGWIGADARTRLAEARRLRSDVAARPTDAEYREDTQRLARRAQTLAEESLGLAQRDIDSQRPDNDDWGWGGGRSQRSGMGGGLLGPVIGGVVLGGLLDDIFD